MIKTMISICKYVVIAIIIVFKFSITAMCLIIHTEFIKMYDIINFNIEVLLDSIGIST